MTVPVYEKLIGFKTSVHLPIESLPEEDQYLYRKMEDHPHTTYVMRICRIVDTFTIGEKGYHLVSNFSKDTYAVVEFDAILPIPFHMMVKLKCTSYFYEGKEAKLMYSFVNLKDVGYHAIQYRPEYFGPLETRIVKDDELIGVNLNDHWIEQAKLQAIRLNWNDAQDFTMLVNHFNTYKNNEDEPK